MADWVLIVPPPGAALALPDPELLAPPLRVQHAGHLRRFDVPGAVFVTAAEMPGDPGMVRVPGNCGQSAWAAAASALLTEREALVHELRAAGRDVTAGTSDCALLAHAGACWGEAAWHRPGGEFAAALWQPDARTMWLATDGEGARPVFWAPIAGGGLAASTRFEALMTLPGVSREPDESALLAYLAMLPRLPETDRTWLAHVKELPPGHVLQWRDGQASRRRWWRFPVDIASWRPSGETEAAACLRETLRQSVRERLRGHGRVAIALSGGMDSPPLAAEAAALRNAGMEMELTAVHAAYPPALQSREAELAGRVAGALEIPLTRVPVDEHPTWPLRHGPHAWPPHHWFGQHEPLARKLAAHGSAVLAGCSGELFSRASFTDALVRGRVGDILSACLCLPRAGIAPRPWRRGPWRRIPRFFVGTLPPLPAWLRLSPQAQAALAEERDTLAAWQPQDTPARLRFLHTLLLLVRRFSHIYDHGPHRVAALNPFADRRVVNLAAAIEPVPWRMEKYLPRVAYQGVLPDAVTTRRRTATPWLHQGFFRSGSAHRLAPDFHPWVRQWVDGELWRAGAPTVEGWGEGFAWLAPLVVSAWLWELEGTV